MKTYCCFLFAILFTLPAMGQDMTTIDKKLAADFEKVNRMFQQEKIDDDSLEVANIVFETNLLKVLNDFPESLEYHFPKLSRELGIVSSPDKKLRAYSWNTNMGGTMKDFQTIFQYRDDNIVKAQLFTGEIGDEEIYYCTDIFQVKTRKGIVYMPLTFMTGTSKYHYQAVKFFKIDNGALNSASILVTEDGKVNEYGVDYIVYWNEADKPDKVIDYDPKEKILKFALTDDQQNVLNTFDYYKFDGENFRKK